MKINFGKYDDGINIRIGICFWYHGHNSDIDKHFHFIIEFLCFYFELTIGEK